MPKVASTEPKMTLSDFVRMQRDTVKNYKAAWLEGQKAEGARVYPRKMTMEEWQKNFISYLQGSAEQAAE